MPNSTHASHPRPTQPAKPPQLLLMTTATPFESWAVIPVARRLRSARGLGERVMSWPEVLDLDIS
jgi:hypothetical protein